MKENIGFIVKNALCCGCGSCVAVCHKAITMNRNCAGFLIPVVNDDLCTHCGLCTTVCPSNSNNIYNIPGDIFNGNCITSYIGYATSSEVRRSSQSGGIVTALLMYLLSSKKVDKVVANKFDSENCEPVSYYASTIEELKQCVGSYYSQTAVCEKIIKENDKKIAAVVLGCQAESLNLVSEKIKILQRPEYLIGLICIGQNSNKIIAELINQSTNTKDKITGFRFKDKKVGGWPGNVTVSTDKRMYSVKSINRLMLKPVYELHRCIPCYDQMNIFSDVVCGDPWGIEIEDKKKGYTVVIARTEKGLQLLHDAEEAGYYSHKRNFNSRCFKRANCGSTTSE